MAQHPLHLDCMGYLFASNISTQDPASDEAIEQRGIERGGGGERALREETDRGEQSGEPQGVCFHSTGEWIHARAILVRCCPEPQTAIGECLHRGDAFVRPSVGQEPRLTT